MTKRSPITETRYGVAVRQIALTGMLLGLIALSAFLSSSAVLPRFPLLNGRLDFWYAVFFIALIILQNWKWRALLIISTPFMLIPLEINNYRGWGDYALELMTPLVFTLPLVPVLGQRVARALQVGATIVLFAIARLGLVTIAGYFFYEVPWIASLTYNAPNIGADMAICVVSVPLALLKLRRVGALNHH